MVPGRGTKSDAKGDILLLMLRGLAGVFLVGALGLALRSALFGELGWPSATLVVGLAAITAVLWLKRDPTPTLVRVLELTLFWFMAVHFVILGVTKVLAQGAEPGAAALTLSELELELAFILLIASYGIFVPSRWTQAMAFVLPVAAGPFVVMVLARAADPSVGAALEMNRVARGSIWGCSCT